MSVIENNELIEAVVHIKHGQFTDVCACVCTLCMCVHT